MLVDVIMTISSEKLLVSDRGSQIVCSQDGEFSSVFPAD
jgi:hypothetical protein